MSEQRFDDVLSEIADKYMPKFTCVIPHEQYQLLEKSENNDGSFNVKIKSSAHNKGKLIGHFIVSLNGVVFNENGDIIIYKNMPVDEEVKNNGFVSFLPICKS